MKKVNAFGEKTYEDVWDEITQEKEGYYLLGVLRIMLSDCYDIGIT